jgi:hypothetical protein
MMIPWYDLVPGYKLLLLYESECTFLARLEEIKRSDLNFYKRQAMHIQHLLNASRSRVSRSERKRLKPISPWFLSGESDREEKLTRERGSLPLEYMILPTRRVNIERKNWLSSRLPSDRWERILKEWDGKSFFSLGHLWYSRLLRIKYSPHYLAWT